MTAGGAGKASLYRASVADLADALEADAHAASDPKLAEWRLDPMLWGREVLGIKRETLEWSLFPGYDGRVWDGTPDPLAAVCRGLAAGRDVGVESAVGTGKTFLLAMLGLWFLDCWEDSLVVTVAPKEDQLTLHMWRWVGHFFPRFQARRPRAELGKLKLRMRPPRDEWAMVGFVAGVGADEEVATKASGFHAVHMFGIFEETPGIKKPVLAAFEQTMVAPHNIRLAVGNPDHQLDPLHEFCRQDKNPGVEAIRASALDHPNVVNDNPELIPGAVGKRSIEKKEAKWGKTGAFYRSRVRGISPAQASDALIRLEWCYAARDRGIKLARMLLGEGAPYEGLMDVPPDVRIPDGLDGPPALGVDVANSKSGDEGAVCRGRGAICVAVEAGPCPDANALGGRVAVMARERGIEPDHIGVDGVGVGAGAVNELQAQGLFVQNLQGSGLPDETRLQEEHFNHLRSQMWYQAREDLRWGRVPLPDDEDLFADLVTPRWTTRNAKIVVLGKEEIRKELGRSPNKGDAFVYWNWVRQVSSGAGEGGAQVGF